MHAARKPIIATPRTPLGGRSLPPPRPGRRAGRARARPGPCCAGSLGSPRARWPHSSARPPVRPPAPPAARIHRLNRILSKKKIRTAAPAAPHAGRTHGPGRPVSLPVARDPAAREPAALGAPHGRFGERLCPAAQAQWVAVCCMQEQCNMAGMTWPLRCKEWGVHGRQREGLARREHTPSLRLTLPRQLTGDWLRAAAACWARHPRARTAPGDSP